MHFHRVLGTRRGSRTSFIIGAAAWRAVPIAARNKKGAPERLSPSGAVSGRSLERVDDLLGHGIMQHVRNTRNQPQHTLGNLLMNPDCVSAMFDYAVIC